MIHLWVTLGLGDLLGGKGNRRNSDSMNARTSNNRQKEKQSLWNCPRPKAVVQNKALSRRSKFMGWERPRLSLSHRLGYGLSLSENEVRHLFSKEPPALFLSTLVGLWRCGYQFKLPIHSRTSHPRKQHRDWCWASDGHGRTGAGLPRSTL